MGVNCPDGNYLEVTVQGVVVLGEFHRGQLSERQLSKGELFRGNCPGSKSLGGNYLGGNFIGGNCPGTSCPGRNYLEVIIRGAKVRRVIVLGKFHERQSSGGQLSREELVRGICTRGKSPGVINLGGIS